MDFIQEAIDKAEEDCLSILAAIEKSEQDMQRFEEEDNWEELEEEMELWEEINEAYWECFFAKETLVDLLFCTTLSL